MRPMWVVALLVMLKEAWPARRDAHVRFLKLQVEILKSRLTGRVDTRKSTRSSCWRRESN